MTTSEPKLITDGQLEAALRKVSGIYSLAAMELGCSRQNVWERVQNNDRLKAVVREVEAQTGDLVEGGIIQLIRKRDRTTLLWYAERKLRDRGYSNRVENDLSRELVDELSAAFGGNLDALKALRTSLG